MTATAPIVCPTCFESFEVPLPPAEETPSEVDYDCEVCCRPMVVCFESDPSDDLTPGEVFATARSLDE